MKKYLIFILLGYSYYVQSQSKEDKQSVQNWFDNFAVCKCISYDYWRKGFNVKDESVKYWNEKTPISKINMENFENFVSEYIKRNQFNGTIYNCLLLPKDSIYISLINDIIKKDLVLKSVNYKIPTTD